MKLTIFKSFEKDLKVMLKIYQLAHRISKTYLPILFTQAFFKALLPFLNIIIPKFIIDELMGAQRVDVLISLVTTVALGNMVLNGINRYFEMLVTIKNEELMNGFDLLVGQKIMNLDFEKIEDPQLLDLKEKALFPIHNQGALYRLIYHSTQMLNVTVTLIGLTAVISMLNPLIILIILIIVLLNSSLNKKMQTYMYEFFQCLIPLNRKFGYYANLTADFSMGKDIRLYHLAPLIMKKIDRYNDESLSYFSKLYEITGKYSGFSQINMQIQMIVVYGYMTYRVLVSSITIGDFTMYVNAANQFSEGLKDFMDNYVQMTQMCRYLEQYIQFDEIKSRQQTGDKVICKAEDYVFEFKNVSFKYPRSEIFTLKDVNICIYPREKLSVVGLNGAGKTTFIKLLTRLYEPTSGEILLNGQNINTFDYDEYMKLLSVVFQDFKLLAFSVKENIAFETCDEVSDEDINKVLEEVGLAHDLSKLKEGIYTSIYKSFDEDGIEFSGGQSQKLAIARAMFKNAPIVVLDEPTAALDPLAEHEIYSHFNELIGEKTTIYISHRLSSCQFCDRIAVFDKGSITQLGSHEELLKDQGNLYETMYRAQAKYYVS